MYAALYYNCLMKIAKVQLKHCKHSFCPLRPFVRKSINSQVHVHNYYVIQLSGCNIHSDTRT